MDNYKELKQQLTNEGAAVTGNLQKITLDLINLVNDGKIESFSFYDNADTLSANHHVRISVSSKKQKDNVQLGIFEHLDEEPRAKHLDPFAFQALKPINEYLAFINEQLPKDVPVIKNQTYYSINAVHGLGGFEREPIKHLLPTFMEEVMNEPKKKNKIK